MFHFLAFLLAQAIPPVTPPQSDKALLITLIVTNVVTLATLIIQGVLGIFNRREDRLDRESASNLALAEAAAREARLAQKIDENTQVSKEAFTAANGHNEKIAKATELAAKAIEVASTKEVHAVVEVKAADGK